MKKLEFLLLTSLFPLLALSQNKAEWVNYSEHNSPMPTAGAANIELDDSGHVWFSSTYLLEFDRQNWSLYDSSHSPLLFYSINAIEIGENGTKWIGTDSGLVKMKGGNWTEYKSDNSGLPDDEIEALHSAENGDLWVGTRNAGIARFDGNNWEVHGTGNSSFPNDHVLCITESDNGKIWTGTLGGIGVYDGNGWTVHDPGNSGLPDYYVQEIAIGPNGSKWIGGYFMGLVEFDGNDWNEYFLPDSNSIEIRSIAIEGDTKWCASHGKGLLRFSSGDWTVYKAKESPLPGDHLNSVAVDPSHNKWIGGSGLTLYRKDGVPVEKFEDKEALSKNPYPNPFNERVRFSIPRTKGDKVELRILSLKGRTIRSIRASGRNRNSGIIWNGKDEKGKEVPEGIYIYRLRSESEIATGRLIKSR